MTRFAYAARVEKTDNATRTTRMILGWRDAEGEDEARGIATASVLADNPGFALSELLVIEVPA